MKRINIKIWLFIVTGMLAFNASAQTSTLQRLEAKIAELEEVVIKQQATIDRISRNRMLNLKSYVRREGNTIIFEGVNLKITNGSGFTNTVNGTGNLIIGYDETTTRNSMQPPSVCSNGRFDTEADCRKNNHTWAKAQKTGSHNLVVGSGHSYTQSGGAVFGAANVINGANTSVLGGSQNISSANVATVVGGKDNVSKARTSVVLGGQNNIASGESASVSGGERNQAQARSSSVTGGQANQANAVAASVSGGLNNIASAEDSSISGGLNNSAAGNQSTVTGGLENNAIGKASSISGGTRRTLNGEADWIAGDFILPKEK